jgi:Domain of unknown function (DUF5658)
LSVAHAANNFGTASTRIGSSYRLVGRVLLIIFAALQIVDVITTNSALARGNWEVNPLMAFAQTHLGQAWWVPKMAALGLVFVLASLTRRVWPLVFAVSFYAVIICGNIA